MRFVRSRRERLADAAAGAAQARLLGRAYEGTKVVGVAWHGAPRAGAELVVVWVLLEGPSHEAFPERLVPDDFSEGDRAASLGRGLASWLGDLQQAVREEFARRDWPRPAGLPVGFELAERIGLIGLSPDRRGRLRPSR